MRAILAAVFLLPAVAAFADDTTGTVLAFDRKAGVIVLTDKTAYSLELLGDVPVEELVAGERVKIEYEMAGEDGLTQITSITRVQ